MREVPLDSRPSFGPAYLKSLVKATLYRRRRPTWRGWGGAFNGQHHRTRAAGELIERFEPDALIETGTYHGFTARHLASYGLPVFTVELDPGIRRIARRALQGRDNVTLLHGDSGAALEWIARGGEVERPFLYLDAHSPVVNPLDAELDTVINRWASFVLLIDDFKVPNDPGYEYWTFKGSPLALEQLSLPPAVRAAFPAVPGTQESGARRGTVYLGQGDGARVIDELVADGTLADPPAGAPRAQPPDAPEAEA